MPKNVWQCSKCLHTSSNKKLIEACEKSHKSLNEHIETIEESYQDMAELPHTLKIKFKGINDIYTYSFTSAKKLY